MSEEKIKLLAETLHGVLVADGVINNMPCSAPELISIAEQYIESKKLHKNMESGAMKVDFNNVRTRLWRYYNGLVQTLNNHRCEEFNGDTIITINTKELEKTMTVLRECIATIAMTYEEGREDFKDVLGDHEIEIFNPFPEDEEEDE